MDKGWRMGEVSSVSVSLVPCSAKTPCLSAVKFELRVKACHRFLHPASFYHSVESGQEPEYSLLLRYKELRTMHKQLQWLYKSLQLPQFPPKKWLVINADAFLQQRLTQLNEYFAQLLTIGEVRRSQVLMQTLAPPTVVKLKLLGQQGSGKTKFIQSFLHYNPLPAEVPSRSNFSPTASFSDNTTPVDVVVDGKTVRIASIEYITVLEGEGSPWFLQGVNATSITLIAKPASDSDSSHFAESHFTGPGKTQVDPETQAKAAYDTVEALLKEYLKLA